MSLRGCAGHGGKGPDRPRPAPPGRGAVRLRRVLPAALVVDGRAGLLIMLSSACPSCPARLLTLISRRPLRTDCGPEELLRGLGPPPCTRRRDGRAGPPPRSTGSATHCATPAPADSAREALGFGRPDGTEAGQVPPARPQCLLPEPWHEAPQNLGPVRWVCQELVRQVGHVRPCRALGRPWTAPQNEYQLLTPYTRKR